MEQIASGKVRPPSKKDWGFPRKISGDFPTQEQGGFRNDIYIFVIASQRSPGEAI